MPAFEKVARRRFRGTRHGIIRLVIVAASSSFDRSLRIACQIFSSPATCVRPVINPRR